MKFLCVAERRASGAVGIEFIARRWIKYSLCRRYSAASAADKKVNYSRKFNSGVRQQAAVFPRLTYFPSFVLAIVCSRELFSVI